MMRVPFAGALIVAAATAATRACPAGRDWPAYGGGPEQTHYSPLTQINQSNVQRLDVAWTFDPHETGGLQTNTIVVGGVLYSTAPRHKVMALDAATGTLQWTFDSGIDGRGPNR